VYIVILISGVNMMAHVFIYRPTAQDMLEGTNHHSAEGKGKLMTQNRSKNKRRKATAQRTRNMFEK
jgi:hypothetical protein